MHDGWLTFLNTVPDADADADDAATGLLIAIPIQS